MAQTVAPSEQMTDPQIERAIELFRAKLRKSKSEFPSGDVQKALSRSEFGPSLLEAFRGLVDEEREIIIQLGFQFEPDYPDWANPIFPDRGSASPGVYGLKANVGLWLHDFQKSKSQITGQNIFSYLKDHRMMESCLSLRDAEEIQKIGASEFRRIFGDNMVFFWRSIADSNSRKSEFYVPYLYVEGDKVCQRWEFIENRHSWGENRPAAIFKD